MKRYIRTSNTIVQIRKYHPRQITLQKSCMWWKGNGNEPITLCVHLVSSPFLSLLLGLSVELLTAPLVDLSLSSAARLIRGALLPVELWSGDLAPKPIRVKRSEEMKNCLVKINRYLEQRILL